MTAPGVPAPAWVAAGAVAFVLAVVSALLAPLMALPDEPAHAVHAVAVVHGELAGTDDVRTDPDTGWTRTETTVSIPQAYAELPALPTCFAFRPEAPAACAPAVDSAAGPATGAVSTVGTYAPPWYAAVGWPALLAPPQPALYGMRVAAAALFAVLVAIAVAGVIRAGAGRWGAVGIMLALPPVAIHLGGGINPSGTEIAAGVALWSTSAALAAGARTRADLVRWAVAGIVVAVTRPLGPALAIAIPVATLLVLRGVATGRGRTNREAWLAAAGVVAAGVASLGWSLWRGTLSAFSGFPAPEATGLAAVRRSLALVPERLAEMVGVLGWSDVSLPMPLVLGWLAAVAAIVAVALWLGDHHARTWLLALAVVVLVLPILADVRSAATIGFVWQGRYTLPVAAGLPVLAGVLLGRRATGLGLPAWGPAGVVAVLGVGHLVAMLAVVRRFRVGVDGQLAPALAAPGAHLAVPGWVLVSVAVLALLVPPGALWGAPARQRSEVSGRR